MIMVITCLTLFDFNFLSQFAVTMITSFVKCSGEFQGPALTAVLEGATLSREEVCNLQFLPPWRLRDTTLNYGLGLLSCYFLSVVPSVVSSGYFYIFDPCGLVLSAPSSHAPTAKMFSLIGVIFFVRSCIYQKISLVLAHFLRGKGPVRYSCKEVVNEKIWL